MENQWQFSSLLDDLVDKKETDQSNSLRCTSISLKTIEDELLSLSPVSLLCDDPIFRHFEEPKKKFNLVAKPMASTSGRELSLFANNFQITCSGATVHQYHVQISPDIASKKLNRRVLRALEEEIPHLAYSNLVFDGWHTVYATKPIDLALVNQKVISMKGVVNTKESPNQFTVHFVHVDTFPLDCRIPPQQQNSDQKLRMIHAIDTIFRQTSSSRFHVVLQSFFSITPQRVINPEHGLGWGTVNLGVGREVCYGFYQNVVETFDMLTMNLDVATTTFYRPIALVEFLAEVLDVPLATVLDGRALSSVQKKKFSKEIAGLKVETRHRNSPRRFRVVRCTWKPINALTLVHSNGIEDATSVSLLDYYKMRYNIELKYQHLPCLEVGRSRECLLPLELCYVVSGQRCIKKLNEQQIANLIKATSRNAMERKDAVLNLRTHVGIDEDPYANQFGLRVDQQMMKIEGRVLSPPRLLYRSPLSMRQDCVTTPNNGTWDMRGKNFYTGVEIQKWAVVCFAPSALVVPSSIRTFVSSLQKVAGEIGMPFMEDHCFCRYAQPDQALSLLQHLQHEQPLLQLIICIVPGKSAIYGDLKRGGDLLGLTTQCVRTHNVTKVSPHTLSNLCMKINSKLGGINVVISTPPRVMTEEPILFVGCHVARNSIVCSSADSSSSLTHIDTSIACLVGSMDGHPTRFAPFFRNQQRHQNTIVDMQEMMREVIVNFKMATGFKPHKIVIYRAGISDAVVDEILQAELRAIRDACASIEHDFQPGVTFIGLDVTHHTRLFAANGNDRVGNSQNVPAGTLVETGITVNNLFEFYLVSHAGIQGTSRPTKYVVMWDDNKMASDEIHQMTYQLCHTQSRCTRSVSIPSPVYYAKLVAQRAKILMTEEDFDFATFREMSRRSEGMLFT
uniref:Uncharacterized protein n=1 Tax=Caenorhabditis japonica TaxID=281687 RepID=A0A8R1DSF6_CAEJA